MRHHMVNNVNDALSKALFNLVHEGVRSPSRNGDVLRFPHPVLTEYINPRDRVLFSPLRNANPTFHLLESLWMLEGRRDVEFPATFVARMSSFSDDGVNLNAAYGYRWRKHFGYDQVQWIIDALRAEPSTRRCVLAMWDPGNVNDAGEAVEGSGDLYAAFHGSKDVPCNTHVYFNIVEGRLNMTISNRSNDIIWGAYGANAVHMSVLMEYVAAAVGVPMGRMYQLSNDLHLYVDSLKDYGGDMVELARDAHVHDRYARDIKSIALLGEGETIEDFDIDLELFFDAFDRNGQFYDWRTQFFRFTVDPMVATWQLGTKNNAQGSPNYPAASSMVSLIGAPDWRESMRIWVEARRNK